MKMFRLALAGILPAFVLLVGIQTLARAASAPPPPEVLSWSLANDTVNHIWQPVGMLDNGATFATAKLGDGFSLYRLDFEDRVAYQRAIEEVYWRHRIWPKERPDHKPSLDAVMSQATIEQKVQDCLRQSELLEQGWQKPITAERLQAEMERMASNTKQPEVLRELFAALGNDPFVIAECLARPLLSERLVTNSNAQDQKNLEPWSARTQDQMPNIVAASATNYTLPAISDQPSECIDASWTATSTTGAPDHRYFHTAVWTGSEMIIWGGNGISDDFLRTGGRYNPATDTWTATTTANAPDGRYNHTAVWTGSEMIVWGGIDSSPYLNTGGRYNPGTDTWTATTTANAPTARGFHTAVWTGSEMIVWGGYDGITNLNTGGRYNPGTDSWTTTSTTNTPTARFDLTAVWTGSEMIVWGGFDGSSTYFNTGGRYNPNTDSWTATTTINAPTGRLRPGTVWTGSEMIAWGGFNGSYLNTGGRYNPGTDSWTATTITNPPTGRYNHTAVWTGSEMIVWGGYDGSIYLNSGARYNPGTDSWTATNTTNAPTARGFHTAVLTSSEMIVWGGLNNANPPPHLLNTGGRYCAQAGSPTITLEAKAKKVGGINTVSLTWSGATSTEIDVYRDSVLIVSTANDGSYRDSTGDTGRARYTYQVCEAGSGTCSNTAKVKFSQ